MNAIPVRVGVQQRVLPSYRVPFFDALARECPQGLSVFAGEARADEMVDSGAVLVDAHYFPARNFNLLRGSLYSCLQINILDWLQQWQPQVLVMEANPRYPFSRAAMGWMRRHGGKIIGWGLGSPQPAGVLSAWRLAGRRNFIDKFDALITYSLSGAREYAALGFDPQRIFTAPNAVAPKPTLAFKPRAQKFNQGKATLLFVGRLQVRKKADLLIRACALLPIEQQPFLWIVGDGPMRRELEELAMNICPQTRFYGAQHGKELELLLQSADLFVLPGTGGLAVQQAMSFGLPVIVGQADGTQSDLVRAENGWLFADNRPETLSRLIQQALGDVPHLRQMGAASYQIVSQEVNLENMVAAFSRAIASVLEG